MNILSFILDTVTVSPSHVKNQVLKAGKSGKITCQFEGDPVQIIWDKAGMERLPPSRMLPQDNVLVIKTVVKGDAGVYMCSAFDGLRAIVGSVNVSVQGMLKKLRKKDFTNKSRAPTLSSSWVKIYTRKEKSISILQFILDKSFQLSAVLFDFRSQNHNFKSHQTKERLSAR